MWHGDGQHCDGRVFSGTRLVVYMSDPKKRRSVSWAPKTRSTESQETNCSTRSTKIEKMFLGLHTCRFLDPKKQIPRKAWAIALRCVLPGVFPGPQETTFGPQETTDGITVAARERQRDLPAGFDSIRPHLRRPTQTRQRPFLLHVSSRASSLSPFRATPGVVDVASDAMMRGFPSCNRRAERTAPHHRPHHRRTSSSTIICLPHILLGMHCCHLHAASVPQTLLDRPLGSVPLCFARQQPNLARDRTPASVRINFDPYLSMAAGIGGGIWTSGVGYGEWY